MFFTVHFSNILYHSSLTSQIQWFSNHFIWEWVTLSLYLVLPLKSWNSIITVSQLSWASITLLSEISESLPPSSTLTLFWSLYNQTFSSLILVPTSRPDLSALPFLMWINPPGQFPAPAHGLWCTAGEKVQRHHCTKGDWVYCHLARVFIKVHL